jgi:DNA-binding beta-propeller fold protein YncE
MDILGQWRSSFLLLLALFLLSSFVGCVPPGPGGGYTQLQPVERAEKKGRLSLFLNLKETDGPDISMQIAAVDLLAENGAWQNYYSQTVTARSGQIGEGQQFLARMALPPDKYTRIRLKLGEVQLYHDGGQESLSPKSDEVVLELRDRLHIAEADSRSLFLTWDTKSSLQEGRFAPELLIAPQLQKLIADVAYVACPDIDTVFMISTEKNRVIDSIGIPGGPIQLLQNGIFGRDRVFVLTGSELISFSTFANEVIERNNLSMTRKAVHMAFSPSGRWGYIIDQQRGSVLRMDMHAGAVVGQARLNYAPNYIVFHEEANLLAVSVGIAQNVVVLDPESLKTISSISTGVNPDGLMSWEDRRLYIAETGSNSVMVYDFAAGAMVKRIRVGFMPRRIAHSDSFIYVTNPGSRSISVLQPRLLGVSRTISFPDGPLEMAYTPRHKWLYVGCEQGGRIAIIDPLTNEMTGSIELGATPRGILVIE